jgi:hypothetical protein
MNCKKYCKSYKKIRPGYGNGQKYCSDCSYYIMSEKKFCPCCGRQYRICAADKNLPAKRKLRK